jgi:hypothetical protein
MRPFLFVAALVAVLSGCTSPDSQAPSRVMVLGIDGGTWDVMVPMMERGQLPNIKSLYDRGLHGVLESRPPVVSPVVWTTIFTARPHEEHGVVDWKTSQQQHRKVEALWDITREVGVRSYVFNVPGSWPPEPIDGVMVSGFPLSGGNFGGNTGYSVTRTEIEKGRLPAAYRRDTKAVQELVRNLEEGEWSDWITLSVPQRPDWKGMMRARGLPDDKVYLTPYYRIDDGFEITYPKDVNQHLTEVLGTPYIPEGPGWSKYDEPENPEYLAEHLEQVFDLQTRAAENYLDGDWRLLIFVMTLVDRISHPYWAYFEPEAYPDMQADRAERYGHWVPDSYRETDEAIGRFLAKARPQDYVVLLSDHGFHSNRSPEKMIGTHDFDGIYLVAGPGTVGREGSRTYIEDAGATILYLMGLEVGRDMQGKVFPELPEMVGRNVAFRDSWEKADRSGTDEPVDEDTWEQLKGLGYVEGDAPTKKKPAAPAAGGKETK